MGNNKKYIPPWIYAKELHDKMLKGWEEAAKAPHEPRRPLPPLTADEALVQKYGYLVWMDNPKKMGKVKLKEVLYEMHLISYEELLEYPDGQPFFDI